MPVTCHLAVVLVPWWARVFLHDLSNIKEVFGGPLGTALDLLASLAIAIAALIGKWVEWKKAFKYAAVVVIVIAVIANTYLVSRISRLQAADSAMKESEGASQYAEQESDPNRRPALTGPPQVLTGPRLMIVDQGISQIMGHIYFAVQQRFPEFDLRTVSLHFVPQGSDKVWDLVQEGEHMRDKEFFGLKDSFVGAALIAGHRKYCRDVSLSMDECKPLQPPIGTFQSLLCIPLKEHPQTAALCFDSKLPDAFDDREQALEDFLMRPNQQLGDLLTRYENLR